MKVASSLVLSGIFPALRLSDSKLPNASVVVIIAFFINSIVISIIIILIYIWFDYAGHVVSWNDMPRKWGLSILSPMLLFFFSLK